MNAPVYLPTDEFGGTNPPDLDLAADYLELSAAFYGSQVRLAELAGSDPAALGVGGGMSGLPDQV